jgi:hypothetical protein
MTMSDLLYRTLNSWKFTGETLHDNVDLWDPKWKSDWEEWSAVLFCELELHEALCDALAEVDIRARHAGKEQPLKSIEEFQHLTQTLHEIESTGDVSVLQDDQDVIQRLKPEEQVMFVRVVQQLFPDKPEALTILQNLPSGHQKKTV